MLLAEQLDKSLVQQGRNSLFSVVAAQQHTQQIGWLFDEFRLNIEDMPQDKFYGCVVSQHIGRVLLLGIVQRRPSLVGPRRPQPDSSGWGKSRPS